MMMKPAAESMVEVLCNGKPAATMTHNMLRVLGELLQYDMRAAKYAALCGRESGDEEVLYIAHRSHYTTRGCHGWLHRMLSANSFFSGRDCVRASFDLICPTEHSIHPICRCRRSLG